MIARTDAARRCLANGDIYKKQYQVKYCVGCELEKTESELVDGKCPIHPTYTLELIDEENYFFHEDLNKVSLTSKKQVSYYWIDPRVYNAENQKYFKLFLSNFNGTTKSRDFSFDIGFAQPHPNNAPSRIVHEKSCPYRNPGANTDAVQPFFV